MLFLYRMLSSVRLQHEEVERIMVHAEFPGLYQKVNLSLMA